MTCIVGLVHDSRVWIGGDSAGVGGFSLTTRADLKVFHNGPFIMGFTSSFRMGQLLQYAFKPPVPTDTEDLMPFMVTTFIDAVRKCFKTGGVATRKSGEENCGTFLVGYKDRLMKVDEDYQIGLASIGFDACGCGEEFALGALYTTMVSKKPESRVLRALKAAEKFSAGVSGPFHIISTK